MDVRIIKHGKQQVFHVASMDDKQNVLLGLNMAERLQILEGVLRSTYDPETSEGMSQEARDLYATWAGLEVLKHVVRKENLVWTTRPRKTGRQTDTGVEIEKPRHTYLLEDLIKGHKHHPLHDAFELSREVSRVRRSMFKRLFKTGIYVTTPLINWHVLEHLHAERGIQLEQSQLDDMVDTLRNRKTVRVADRFSITHNTIPTVLAYYGLSDPQTKNNVRGHAVKYWLMLDVLEQVRKDPQRNLSLQDIYWMDGHYNVVGQ